MFREQERNVATRQTNRASRPARIWSRVDVRLHRQPAVRFEFRRVLKLNQHLAAQWIDGEQDFTYCLLIPEG